MKRIALFALAVLLMAAFISLGRWQLRRAEFKEGMSASVARVLANRRVEPLDQATAADTTDYAWVAGRGSFRPGPVLLLDNQRRGESVGVRVFGVFAPVSGSALLVDLGWLPLPGNRRLPAPRLPTGEVAVSGLFAPPPASGIALGADHVPAGAGRWLLTRVDTQALSRALRTPLASRVLRLDPLLPLGYARDLDVLPNTLPPEQHRGYAVQWFGLAAAVFLIAVFMGFRKKQ